MKRMLLTLTVLGLAGVSSSRADWGGYGPPAPQSAPVQTGYGEFSTPNTLMGMGAGQPGKSPDRYGVLPSLRRTFRIGGEGCDTCANPKPGLLSKLGTGGSGGCATCNIGNRFGNGGWGHGGNGGWGHGGGNGGWGHGGGNGGGYGNDYPQYPPMMQGTLVFPNHQFARSPRDFFMYEPGR